MSGMLSMSGAKWQRHRVEDFGFRNADNFKNTKLGYTFLWERLEPR